MPQHGEYITEGQWLGCRWCEVCNQYHGGLFPCPHYSPDVLQDIKLGRKVLMENLQSENWVNQQIENGVPPEAIVIMRILARL